MALLIKVCNFILNSTSIHNVGAKIRCRSHDVFLKLKYTVATLILLLAMFVLNFHDMHRLIDVL